MCKLFEILSYKGNVLCIVKKKKTKIKEKKSKEKLL